MRFLMISLSVLISSAAMADDWAQFRGPNCTGIYPGKAPLPGKFSKKDNLVWSTPLADGIGSPVVVQGRVYVTAFVGKKAGEEKKAFQVLCFDATTGKEQWRREFPAGDRPLPAIHDVNSHASTTPAADADRVYVYFPRTGLMAFDARTGETAWKFDVPEPFFIFDWGPGMSPVLHGDTVFFCQDDDVSPALYAIDKTTGQLRWKDDRSDMAVSYSHPVTCPSANGTDLVVAGTGKLLGYDIATGKRKWAAQLNCRNIKTTPISLNGVIYVSLESTGITYQWRAVADPDGSGKITKDAIKAFRKDKGAAIPDAFWKKFDRGDINKDGVLEGDEIDRAFLDPANQGGILASEVKARGGNVDDWRKWDASLQSESFFQAVRGGGEGDVSKTHIVWRIKSKAPDGLVSPLVVDDRLLLVKSGGIVNLFDTAKADKLWTQERLGIEGRIVASPVRGDGKIYVIGEQGAIVTLSDGPEFKILDRSDLEETIAATPALADGRVVLRSRAALYCFRP